ncbi:hypothetical protein DFA_02877 [Cavenderia fasciculata]|uniref:Uncharacterized protein n=1 Tax=Cavenderia fasciculata TaxID=261658 RepID=F4PIQ4_CACFS|nr:uncharacterized protein DFA_02877 [Cavenderia fasciculata]EGG24633.1 hypothetical protein DFA_02877 [Cavenderia fasciculata]|eukprot:XP_004362484.1 hypothetical protein DFA_02877 [Cavenderia fasciculata]
MDQEKEEEEQQKCSLYSDNNSIISSTSTNQSTQTDSSSNNNNNTLDTFNELYKKDLFEICQINSIMTTGRETKNILLDKIKSSPKKISRENSRVGSFISITAKDVGVKDGNEASLPWPIVFKIIGMAWYSIEICTCIHRQDNHGKLILVSESICPLHKYMEENDCLQSFNFDSFMDTRKFNGVDSYIWRLELALVSKKVFYLVSTSLLNNISMKPEDSYWRHIQKDSCLIKNISTLVVLQSLSQKKLFNRDIDLTCRTFGQVEKIYIKGLYLVENPSNIYQLSLAMPNLSKIVCYSPLNGNTIKSILSNFKNITSINFAWSPSDLSVGDASSLLTSIGFTKLFDPNNNQQLIKIMTPIMDISYHRLHQNIKSNLQVIKADYYYSDKRGDDGELIPIYEEFKIEEFPKLRHIHLSIPRIRPFTFIVPKTVTKITLYTVPSTEQLSSLFLDNPSINTIRFRDIANYRCVLPSLYNSEKKAIQLSEILKLDWRSCKSISTIIIDSLVDIVDVIVDQFHEKGFYYRGCTISNISGLKQLIFTKSNLN